LPYLGFCVDKLRQIMPILGFFQKLSELFCYILTTYFSGVILHDEVNISGQSGTVIERRNLRLLCRGVLPEYLWMNIPEVFLWILPAGVFVTSFFDKELCVKKVS